MFGDIPFGVPVTLQPVKEDLLSLVNVTDSISIDPVLTVPGSVQPSIFDFSKIDMTTLIPPSVGFGRGDGIEPWINGGKVTIMPIKSEPITPSYTDFIITFNSDRIIYGPSIDGGPGGISTCDIREKGTIPITTMEIENFIRLSGVTEYKSLGGNMYLVKFADLKTIDQVKSLGGSRYGALGGLIKDVQPNYKYQALDDIIYTPPEIYPYDIYPAKEVQSNFIWQAITAAAIFMLLRRK